MMTHAEAVALIERTLQDYLLGRVRREPRLAEHLATLLGFTDPGRAPQATCGCGWRGARRAGMNNAGRMVLWCPQCGHEVPWSVYPDYRDSDSAEIRLATCIRFEFAHGGNEIAAARAILRDVARGDIVLPSREPAPAALPPEAHQFYADLNRRATAVDLKLARRHQ